MKAKKKKKKARERWIIVRPASGELLNRTTVRGLAGRQGNTHTSYMYADGREQLRGQCSTSTSGLVAGPELTFTTLHSVCVCVSI